MASNLFYFNKYNKKGIRRRGLKFITSEGSFRTFFFKKKRSKLSRLFQRSRSFKTQKFSRLSSFPNRLKFLSLKNKLKRRSRSKIRGRIRYRGRDSHLLVRKKFSRRKKGYINTSALLRGESSIFRPSLKKEKVVLSPFYQKVNNHLMGLYEFNRRTFLRYKKLFLSAIPSTDTLGYRPFSAQALRLYLRSVVRYVAKTYISKFKFFSRFINRTPTTFQFLKRFELSRKLKTLQKLKSVSAYQKFVYSNSKFSDSISIQLLFAIKKFLKRFFKFSYSFFIRKNYITEKNKSFFENFRLKLSTYLALHQSLTLTYYKHFFLNNSFFIRFIPTNSNFFINFGFYDKVIFQLSAGHPIVGFTNSARANIPAVIKLVRYFLIRLKVFIRLMFPMIYYSSRSKSRSLRRRRLKVPVYYVMEKGVDKRVKIAFKQIRVKSFWRVMGIRFYAPLPHGHTLRAAKRRRR